MVPFLYIQSLDVMRQTKIAEVLGTDFNKEQSLNKERAGRRSNSRERSARRDSLDSVSYEKVGGNGGDEVSIGVEWSGDGVSMSTLELVKGMISNTTRHPCPPPPPFP